MPTTVGRGRKPGNRYESERRRRGLGNRIAQSCQVFASALPRCKPLPARVLVRSAPFFTQTNPEDPNKENNMKIVVIGGTGLIGKKLVNKLSQNRHEVVAASPASGVNTITGEGLAKALAGAQVVVDVANSP